MDLQSSDYRSCSPTRHSGRASIISEDLVFLDLRHCVPNTWLLSAKVRVSRYTTDITFLESISKHSKATLADSKNYFERTGGSAWLASSAITWKEIPKSQGVSQLPESDSLDRGLGEKT